MRKYVTEFIGTFLLVLTIGFTVIQDATMAPIAIGAVLIGIIFMGGHISSAHYNPAVSLAALMRGALPMADFVPYLIAQMTGALLAALMVYLIIGKTFAPTPGPDFSILGALLAEMVYTFALVLVILNVAIAKGTAGNPFYGLAIGTIVMAGIFAVGPISGAAFNPAVGIGPILIDVLIGGGTLANLWLYLVGPFIGGAVAALVFQFQEAE